MWTISSSLFSFFNSMFSGTYNSGLLIISVTQLLQLLPYIPRVILYYLSGMLMRYVRKSSIVEVLKAKNMTN